MTETNDSQSQSRASRSCVPALVVMATIAGLLVVGIQYLREQQRLSFERQKAERRQRSFDRVKNGDHRASIVDSKLLPMLANDAACVSNLNELDFDMTAITHEDARYVSRLCCVMCELSTSTTREGPTSFSRTPEIYRL